MKAMILAAGLGTRLKPWTETNPKALVPVAGEPMLKRVINNLKSQGFDSITINVHHFADKIRNYIESNDFGLKIDISDETEELLDTGGGIVKAYKFLFEENEDVLVHNVDILSNADLRGLIRKHEQNRTEITLLVSDRESSRKLLFDEEMNLRGWHNKVTDEYRPEGFLPDKKMQEYAFSGIYIISRKGVEEMKTLLGEGKFPIMDYFLSASRKLNIKGEKQNYLELIDIGKPASLTQASSLLINKKF